MDKLKIYKASAGSGKTHTLTEEYLNLAAISPEHFKKILAVTFTNKAAEEMKQRILDSLNEIVSRGEKAGFFHVFQKKGKNEPVSIIIEKAKTIRDQILHDYSYFSLSTIDSFVQKVIKSFTFEIGIDNGYRIELDSEKVIKEITEMLYKQIDNDSDLRFWLIHFANFKMGEGKNWDFRTEISGLAGEIFKEEFQTPVKDKDNNDFQKIIEYFNELNRIKQDFESKLSYLGSEAGQKIAVSLINFENHSRNVTTVINYLTRYLVNPQSQDDFIPGITVIKMQGDPDAWHNKTAKADIVSESVLIYGMLNPILKKAMEILSREYSYYLSAINVLSAFHAFGILNKLSSLLPAYREENNLLLISDTTRMLKEIIAGNDAPFIYEKIGNRYHHVLIDEFQDTSGFQWENFKPLIQNCLAEGNGNLIVGDIKQSIYRWRGGDWNILMNALDKDIGQQYITHYNLETNWRSKKNILDFNNSIFPLISCEMQEIFNHELNDGLEADSKNSEEEFRDIILKAYHDVCQKLPDDAQKAGGRVKIKFFRQEKGEKKEDKLNKIASELPRTIDLLLKQKNCHPGDIAILVRRNSEGRQVARILLEYQQSVAEAAPYQVISSDSLMLVNSPAIQLLVNAMYYLFNPGDSIHLSALILANEQLNHPETEFNHRFFNTTDPDEIKKFLPDLFLSNSEELKKLNVYELCEKINHIFGIYKIEGQQAYLQTFLDIILEFVQNDSVDLGAFLEWWKNKGNSFAVQLGEQQDAVKILSIHKSKGLAFNIVIVPFCDWDIKPQSTFNKIIWTSTDISPFNRIERFPVIYRNYLRKSIFRKEYYREMLHTMIDSLNLLYVAFTRPREELVILAPYKESTSGKLNSVSELLYKAVKISKTDETFQATGYYWNPEEEVFEIKENYQEKDTEISSDKKPTIPVFEIEENYVGDWTEKLRILKHSSEFFIESMDYIKTHVDYGKLMHAVFAKINTIKDIDPVIEDFYYAGQISSEDRDMISHKLKEMTARPEVAGWFSDRWKVKTEEAILDSTGKIRIPDRVLLSKDQTIVVDFKFGEQYAYSHEQVNEYMDLMKNMNYPGVKGFVYYAEKNIVEEVL